MPHHTKDAVAILGIDIGKTTFHLVGLNKLGAIVLRQKLSRRQLEAKLANLPPYGVASAQPSIILGRLGCPPSGLVARQA
jgi:hypothetical protein